MKRPKSLEEFEEIYNFAAEFDLASYKLAMVDMGLYDETDFSNVDLVPYLKKMANKVKKPLEGL